jgi:type VI secretion system secreted protein VgrG
LEIIDMARYTQDNRPLQVATPLGKDKLLLEGLTGTEGLSQLFTFHLEMLAEKPTEVAFDKLLGQSVTVTLLLAGTSDKRFFNGICNRVSQGEQDATFTQYHLEIVPQFWLLTRRAQSRIFQRMSVPDILKKVLDGFDVAYELQGTFEKRDFCAQYRETDFNFASRLMEEEGIYYFFKHADGSHKMVVANTPQSHTDLGNIIYEEIEGGNRPDDRIFSWTKVQELRSGKYTLWDHCFELPHKHLDADKTIQESVSAGKVSHKFKVGGNDKLEIYDFPGGYAQRFDGIDKGGGEQPSELQKIFQDNKRTVEIRMQQEAAQGLAIQGAGNSRQLTSGHKFTLERHFNADGAYVLTQVQHAGRQTGMYRSEEDEAFHYSNSFTCIPAALPFRPSRRTPRPVVQGTQSAVVVGPAGEEIFTDKYSRVKVQFHWDREGKNDADSSCWVRVGSIWAGKQWGAIHIPRIGQEVIVDFLEGDPDQPIIIGSTYNADMMPPYLLPDNKTQSGIKSRSSLQGTPDNFNELCFEDKKGSEDVYFHAEKDFHRFVEHDDDLQVGHDQTITIHHDRTELVDNNEQTTIGGNRTEQVDKNETITIVGNRTEQVDKDEQITIDGNRTENVDKDESITIGQSRTESVGKDESITIGGGRTETVGKDETISIGSNRSHTIGKNDTLGVGQALAITAGDSIIITVGAASIAMKKDGTIAINGKDISLTGSGAINGKASKNIVLKGQKILQN